MQATLPALTLLAIGAAACAASHSEPRASTEPSSPPHVAPALEVFTSDAGGFDTHSYWLDTGREVVVFDAQFTPALAEKVILSIRAKTQSPIRYLVVTHPNPDKFNGAPAFQAVGAKVVASANTARAIPGVHAYKKYFFIEMAKMFTDATYPAEASVDITFSGDLDLELEGSAHVRLHELAHSGVSSTQTVAFVEESRALVVGDLVHHRAHAWLEGGIVGGKARPDIGAWKQALEELRAYPDATVYGGRGISAPIAVAVAAQTAYLDRMNAVVTDYLKALPDAKTELAGPNASEHYRKLTALASQSFPDYGLPYLIEYGVYGLATQIAAQ